MVVLNVLDGRARPSGNGPAHGTHPELISAVM